MTSVPLITLTDLKDLPAEGTYVLATASAREKASRFLEYPLLPDCNFPFRATTVIVIGGGTIIDAAKRWRMEHAPHVKLIAIPSIWGSGAEASPIAVSNEGQRKNILISEKLLPDARAILPELANDLPDELALWGCGDCWSHALEGFLSPMASDSSRGEIGELLLELEPVPLSKDPRWFEYSARACFAQSRSSVGLVHGIAHTLEGPLRGDFPDQNWSHARLCSQFLWPVMRFNEAYSPKWQELARFHLNPQRILETAHSLHDPEAFTKLLPVLEKHWISIIKDPCSRTNCAIVRPSSIEYFSKRQFS